MAGYIVVGTLAAMGLLSEYDPVTALRLMKKELEYDGHSEQTNS